MALDKQTIKKRVTHLNDSVTGLRAILPSSLSGYKGAKDETKRAVERYLQIVSETQFDIIKIVYKSLDKRAVGEDTLLMDALGATLGGKTIAGVKERRNLRNMLVHAYMDIDDAKAFKQASDTSDVEEFKRAVEKLAGSK